MGSPLRERARREWQVSATVTIIGLLAGNLMMLPIGNLSKSGRCEQRLSGVSYPSATLVG